VTVVYNKYVCVTGVVCVRQVCVCDRCVVYVTVCVWVSVQQVCVLMCDWCVCMRDRYECV